MKSRDRCKAEARRKKLLAQGPSAIEEVSGSPELDTLGDLAREYASEIERSPFTRPFGLAVSEPMSLASLSSLLSPALDLDGWYPSHLLSDDTLRQRPASSVRVSRGMLSGIVETSARPTIEGQHSGALAAAFRTARDAHPAYKRLHAVDSFRSVLNEFDRARNRSPLTSTLRAPQAEAQLIECIVRSLWRLSAKDWRPAPTKKAATAAKKAARSLIAAAKDGLHSFPSYYPAVATLRALLLELDAPTTRKRATRLDAYTARRVALAAFEERLANKFGTAAFERHLMRVRQAYAAMLGFQNPSDKISP